MKLVVNMRMSCVVVLIVINFITVRCSLRKGDVPLGTGVGADLYPYPCGDHIGRREYHWSLMDAEYWMRLADEELKEALAMEWNTGIAKNIILFIGDGMGPHTVTATRIHKGGESYRLSYEKFPHVGLVKTYSADKMVPDSASTATALLCGVKANQNTVGVSASVTHRNCSSEKSSAPLKSLAALALEAGKSAGFVTTMRVTHATPAPLYAHSAARQWECDAAVPADAGGCKDIGRQMVEDWPGRDLHVILGGGRQGLVANATGSAVDSIDMWSCSRGDGRNLIEAYKKDKEERGLKYQVVSNSKELFDLNIDETDYLLGVFSNSHLKYEFEKPQNQPSIVNMTEAAIRVLRRNPNGFFLMVEGGNIDMAHHRGRARTAVHEASAMDDAVALALSLTDPRDTLLVVTADHAHSLTINGYPERGSDIFGVTGPSLYDGLNYTTLAYGTGGPGSMQYSVGEHNISQIVRRDPSNEDTGSFTYEQIAAVTLDENKHGGGDVTIYAKGPYAHFFHSVHEQHYVYHALTRAARLGRHSAGPTLRPTAALLVAVITYTYYSS